MLSFPHFLLVEGLHIYVIALTILSSAIIIFLIFKRWKAIFHDINITNVVKLVFNKSSFRSLTTYWLFQGRVLRTPRGRMHMFIYIGIIILFIGTLIRAIDYYFAYGSISGFSYIVFKLFMNIGGLFLFIGTFYFILIRLIKRPTELTYRWDDWLFIGGLFFMSISGFVLSGIVTVVSDRPQWVDPIGSLFGLLVTNVFSEVTVIYKYLWTIHLLLALVMIVLIPITKIGHWLYAFMNISLKEEKPTAVKPIYNILESVEHGKTFGVVGMDDFQWKQRLDFASCTRCGRCQTVCPAYESQKPLSPARLIQKLGMRIGQTNIEVIPGIVESDEVWSCTTCGACVHECPVFINHTSTIVDLRRGLISRTSEHVPDQVYLTLNNVMRSGNPYGLSYYDRSEWLDEAVNELGIEYASEDSEYDYLYWLGCNINFDPTQRQTAKDLIRLVKIAGYKIAVLSEEICCGEPIRKLGDEVTYKIHVEKIVELLSRYKFKYLLVSCPHGYNNFKNYFSQFGYKIDVKHSTEVLREIIESGLVEVQKSDLVVTYHDPCNLARWNDVHEDPRLVLHRVADLKEMKRIRGGTFCCGAGGGQYFYQLNIGERISKIRVKEAKSTGASTIVVACPFCRIMLKEDAENEGLNVTDITTLVASSLRKK